MKARTAFFACVVVVVISGALPVSGTTVVALSWAHDSNERTTVTVVFDAPMPVSSFRSYRLSEPARAVLVIEGATPPVNPAELVIEDRFVKKIRLVDHPERRPREFLLVFDLESPAAAILEIRHDSDRITAVVGDPESTMASSTPTFRTLPPIGVPTAVPTARTEAEPSRTPGATRTAVQTGTAAETGSVAVAGTETGTGAAAETEAGAEAEAAAATTTATATATATATRSPTLTRTPTPSPMPTYPDRPAPPVLPSVPAPATETPEPPPPTRPPVDATPTPDPDPAVAQRVVEITASGRGDGSTLLRITADGRIPQGCVRVLNVSDDPPRMVITIRGLSAPDLPRSITFDDPNIERIRLIHDAETIDGELHLVLHLTRLNISVKTTQQVGPNFVVLLVPAD